MLVQGPLLDHTRLPLNLFVVGTNLLCLKLVLHPSCWHMFVEKRGFLISEFCLMSQMTEIRCRFGKIFNVRKVQRTTAERYKAFRNSLCQFDTVTKTVTDRQTDRQLYCHRCHDTLRYNRMTWHKSLNAEPLSQALNKYNTVLLKHPASCTYRLVQ